MIKRYSVLTRSVAGLVIIALLLSACQQKKKGGFTVEGEYKNADKLALMAGPVGYAYLLEVPYGKEQAPVILDSAKLAGNNGRFSLSGTVRAQEVYEVVFGNNALAVPLVNDAADVKINVDLGKKDDFYETSGSEASAQLRDLINFFGRKNFEMEQSMSQLDSLKGASAPDSVLLAATNKKNSAIQELNTYLRQFINTNNNPTLCALALGWSSRSFSKSEFESALNDLVKKFPDHVALRGIKQDYEQQLAQMAQKKDSTWVGRQAPDLALPDPQGRTVSISSFKGKYLLVDFWASWCGPCRAENPNVVQAYSEFKHKNFAILGVSLDKEKDAWLEAIKDDRLSWTHVSDLKYWQSKAVEVFQFQGIPFNILIDPQGKIIAQGLRGDELESKLKEVLN
ncbi:TlpA disulfide reductase family protein [Flavitalea sp. BT771]|uniref:TlpA disulfide reductase family protein n=1 Tax=Flavitalea sp. BT771 TaxID=3063329 RepID=UPI0026E24F5D|nr:TlpA disulfide reductase family protein [Flavitalea sp. BT771]MDO6434112.1 TlpA disulfide reductase family protein [Flavitalea sp. BT771]MDV6223012.1 TlpA disulfide reductase family protein [Flavitalea sp. BT771]